MKKINRAWLFAALLPFLFVRTVSLLWRFPFGSQIVSRQAGRVNMAVKTPVDPTAVSVEGTPATFVRTSPDTIEVSAIAVTYERRFTNLLGRPKVGSERFANVLISYPGSTPYVRTVDVS